MVLLLFQVISMLAVTDCHYDYFVTTITSSDIAQSSGYSSMWNISTAPPCSKHCLLNRQPSEVDYYELRRMDGSKRWCVCVSGFVGAQLRSDTVTVARVVPREGRN